MSSQDYSEHYIGLPHRIPLQKATIVILESDLISLALDVLFMSMLSAIHSYNSDLLIRCTDISKYDGAFLIF